MRNNSELRSVKLAVEIGVASVGTMTMTVGNRIERCLSRCADSRKLTNVGHSASDILFI